MMDADGDVEMVGSNGLSSGPFRLDDSEQFNVDEHGTVSVRMKLDRDQIECCVCYSAMTGSIYRCGVPGKVSHNVCFDCEWQIRRLKEGTGHVKPERCPVCKIEGRLTRNISLERTLRELCKPCVNNKRGCEHNFFQWHSDLKEEHEKRCSYGVVCCPLCEVEISGCSELQEHLRSGDCQLGSFIELDGVRNPQKNNQVEFLSGMNSFFAMPNYIILFIWKDDLYFEIMAMNTDGNFKNCNKQTILDIVDTQKWNTYSNLLSENSYLETLTVPQRQRMFLNLGSFKQKIVETSNGKERSPEGSKRKLQTQKGHFWAGKLIEPRSFTCRCFSLGEILSKGCTLDCRDYFGKWYEAEVLAVSSENPYRSELNPKTDHIRIHVHYLGYSSSYDEWFDLGSDASRVAPAGTFTVGPNLRSKRRNSNREGPAAPNLRSSAQLPHMNS